MVFCVANSMLYNFLSRVLKLLFLHFFFQKYSQDIDGLPGTLAEKVILLPGLIRDSRAKNTAKSYNRGFQRWRNWVLANGLGGKNILPAKVFHVALYLVSLIQTSNSPSPVVNAFYSLKWFHNMLDIESPTDSRLVSNILEAAKRRLAKPVCKKEPITPDLLDKMYKSLFNDGNVKNQRIICACLLAYAGFLRSSELLNIRRCDITIFGTYMSVFIQSSKTDQYRDGAWVVISRTGTQLCPVENLERYLLWADIKEHSEVHIFSTLSACKNGSYKIRRCNKVLSYTSLRELFIEAFKPHVQDISSFSLHSLRSGGASASARGIPDRLFKRHGRWRSETAKDGYVKDDLSERLKVSQCLGL